MTRLVRATTKSPIDLARDGLEEARAKLEGVRATQSERVASFRAAFNADQVDESADALALAERRAEILVAAATAKVGEAESAVAQAEADAKGARIAELDQSVKGINGRLADLAKKSHEPIAALVAIAQERDELIRKTTLQAIELSALRGETDGIGTARRRDVEAKAGILKQMIAASFPNRDRGNAVTLLDGLFIQGVDQPFSSGA
ncbi:MAG TPA: hypothetical protein VH062_13510 [Polyangiaceae bacterium]|nr:hypothetical protein [Polyangiaceae bacterium]